MENKRTEQQILLLGTKAKFSLAHPPPPPPQNTHINAARKALPTFTPGSHNSSERGTTVLGEKSRSSRVVCVGRSSRGCSSHMKGVLDPTNLVDCQQRLSTTDSIPSMESVSKEEWRPYVDHIGSQAVKNAKDEDGLDLKQFWKYEGRQAAFQNYINWHLAIVLQLLMCFHTLASVMTSHQTVYILQYTPVYLLFTDIPLSPLFSHPVSFRLLYCLHHSSLVISMLYNVSLCLYRYSMIVRLSSQHT